MLRVGLTGGIASGKSAVSRRLAERGAVVIDADLLAREVVEPGTDGLAAIVEAFGSEVLAADGALDRPVMAKLVFADAEARKRLEAIIHPRVRARAAEIEAAAEPGAIVVHDIPLLVETGQADRFDLVLVVDVPAELQVRRLVTQRGMSEDEARARIGSQASRDDRLAVAALVVDNSGSLADLDDRIDAVWAELIRRTDGGAP